MQRTAIKLQEYPREIKTTLKSRVGPFPTTDEFRATLEKWSFPPTTLKKFTVQRTALKFQEYATDTENIKEEPMTSTVSSNF